MYSITLGGSLLDTWVFERVSEFFKKANDDEVLSQRLKSDKIVFFLHLLGLDTIGHSKRPYSDAYLDDIVYVDRGIEEIVRIIEDFYGDNRTSYIFTSDHGMSDKGMFFSYPVTLTGS